MKKPSQRQITELLKAWSDGDQSALEELMPLVYEELHRRAQHYMSRERRRGTLQTTVLVNELYLRLFGLKRIRWQDRAHFYNLASRMMRRLLVDYFRKLEFRVVIVPLDETSELSSERSPDLVALDDALNALEEIDARKSRVVDLRFFAGRSVEETAEILDVSVDTVHRDWRLAKIWLVREMKKKK